MSKTLRHPQTGEVRTVPGAEAEKLSKTGWVYSSKYELKRQAAMVKAKQPQSVATDV